MTIATIVAATAITLAGVSCHKFGGVYRCEGYGEDAGRQSQTRPWGGDMETTIRERSGREWRFTCHSFGGSERCVRK